MRTFERHKTVINSLAYSPDGSWLLTINADSSVDLWDPSTGSRISRLEMDSMILEAYFTPDSQEVLRVSFRNGIRRWPVYLLAEAIKRRPRELTSEERQRYGLSTAGQQAEEQVSINE